MPNPKTPVLVGIAQILQRTDDLDTAKEPLELMVDAVRAAAEDAGSRELLTRAGSVRVVRGIWKYEDPGRYIASEVGCPSAQTAITPFGGNFVQTLVNRSCLDIQSGEQDIVLVVGAECGRSAARIRKEGREFPWRETPGTPDLHVGQEVAMAHEAEMVRGIRAPIQMYPIFDNALRYERGESIEAHRRRISELWASFSEVASKNPNAWIQDRKTAAEIADPNAKGNRAVSFPYPMLMNSNSRVDMGAALILTTEETAKSLGIPREKWVYPHAGTDAHDHYFVSERESLSSSPGIRLAGRRCLELAGVEPSGLAYQDVYSCFPSAVQVAAKEIGLDTSKPLTVTGGLTFGGGPLNNYVMHGIARMAELLREAPGEKGLCTANGGFLTKHAFGVYSTEPPSVPFQHADLQDEVDALPKREAVVEHEGEVTLESYTVMYEGSEPAVGHAACLLPDGGRTWANIPDRDVAAAMTTEEFCGRAGRVSGGIFSAN
jgi:acetyl-CoA C-acetyltransferase